MNFTEAFARFGAVLVNPQWAFSAFSPDGSVVISCWQHKFSPANGKLRYVDNLSRIKGNEPGKNLCANHLATAQNECRNVRFVIAEASDRSAVDNGDDASQIRKKFFVRSDFIGRVVKFDGDNFVIEVDRIHS